MRNHDSIFFLWLAFRASAASLLLGILAVAELAPAQAQDRKIEQAIKHRQGAFSVMSIYFSRLLQTVKGDRPYDLQQTVSDAKTVEFLSRLLWEGFAPGTDKGNTHIKDDIWLDEDKFKELAAELQTKTTLLAKAAETGDLKRITQAFESTRDICSACHKTFRND